MLLDPLAHDLGLGDSIMRWCLLTWFGLLLPKVWLRELSYCRIELLPNQYSRNRADLVSVQICALKSRNLTVI